jgi:hypothetical protein
MNILPQPDEIRQEAEKLARPLIQDIAAYFHPLHDPHFEPPLLESEEDEIAQKILPALTPYIELALVVKTMREQHSIFYSTIRADPRHQSALVASKQLERHTDAIIKKLFAPKEQETMPL